MSHRGCRVPKERWSRGLKSYLNWARVRLDRRSECARQVKIRAQLAQNECDKQKEEDEKGERGVERATVADPPRTVTVM